MTTVYDANGLLCWQRGFSGSCELEPMKKREFRRLQINQFRKYSAGNLNNPIRTGTFSVPSLYQWPRHCTPKARETVLNIISSSKTPLAPKDIYDLAIKPARASTPAPHAGLRRSNTIHEAWLLPAEKFGKFTCDAKQVSEGGCPP